MSYRCQMCLCQTDPGIPMNKVVTRRREKVYLDKRGNEVASGWEAAEEKAVCPACIRWEQQRALPTEGARFLPTFLRRDGDGRVRLNSETPQA